MVLSKTDDFSSFPSFFSAEGDFFGSTCPKDHFGTVLRVFQLRYFIFVSQAHKILCKKWI